MKAFKRLEATDHVISPFETHKEFTYDEQSDNINVIDGVFYKGIFNPSEPQTKNGLYQRTVWHFINQLYYRFKEEPFTAFGPVGKRNLRRINGDVRVFSFGQQQIGEGIQTGSFQLVHHPGQGDEITLIDDGYGNLIEKGFDTSSAPDDDKLTAFWNFNEGYLAFKQGPSIYNQSDYNIAFYNEFQQPRVAYDKIGDRDIEITGSEWVDSISETGLSFHSRSLSEGNFSEPISLSNKFSLNYWANVTGSGTLVGKKDDNNGNYLIQDTGSVTMVWNDGVSNTFNFTGSYGSTNVMTTITAERENPTSSKYRLEFYENGTLVDSGSHDFFTAFEFDNFGNSNSANNQITGSVDEFRVYGNHVLTGSEITFLYDNPSNQISVGNVFYNHGIATITNKDDNYFEIASGSEPFVLSYNATHTIYEHEFHCTINPSEFNVSMNPTSRTGSESGGPKLKPNITGSNWDPYITTIGLYDDLGRLIFIGKLARPLKNDSDIPKTIVLRTDF